MISLINIKIRDSKKMNYKQKLEYYKELLECRIRTLNSKMEMLMYSDILIESSIYKSNEEIDMVSKEVKEEFDWFVWEYKNVSTNTYDKDLDYKINMLELKCFSHNPEEDNYIDYNEKDWFKKKTKSDYACEREFDRIWNDLLSERRKNKYQSE